MLCCVVLCCVVLCCVVLWRVVSCRVVSCCALLCCVELCCVVLCCVVLCCVVLCCVVLCCVVLCCVVLCCVVLCCVVPKALLPEGNGRDVYPRVHVNGRAVCLSARCVLVCYCTAGNCALSHLAGTVLPTPVHDHTGSKGPLHRVCCAAPSVLCVRCRTAWCGLWTSCNTLPHCPGAVGSGTSAAHRRTA